MIKELGYLITEGGAGDTIGNTHNTFQSFTLDTLHRLLIRNPSCFKNEVTHQSPREKLCLAMNNCITQIRDPQKREVIIPGRNINYAFAIAEALWILAGKGDYNWIKFYNKGLRKYLDPYGVFGEKGEFWGSYGIRLRKMPVDSCDVDTTVDQLGYVIRKLREDKFSRQAVCNLWDSRFDTLPSKKDYPCNTMLMFNIVDSHLDMTVIRRSNDIVLGVPYNAFQFALIQEYVAQALNLPVGTQTIYINNLHIYAGEEYDRLYQTFDKMMYSSESYRHNGGKMGYPYLFELTRLWNMLHEPQTTCLAYHELPSFEYFLERFFSAEARWHVDIARPDFGEFVGEYVAHQCDYIEGWAETRNSYWVKSIKFLFAYHLYKAGHDAEAIRIINSLKDDLFLVMWYETCSRYTPPVDGSPAIILYNELKKEYEKL